MGDSQVEIRNHTHGVNSIVADSPRSVFGRPYSGSRRD